MKKKLLIGIMMCTLLLTSGCNEKKEENKKQTQNTTNETTPIKNTGVLVNETKQKEIKDKYGVTITKLVVAFSEKTLNLQISVGNETNEDIEFDFSKLSLKTQEQETLKVNATKKTIKANSAPTPNNFIVEAEGKVSEQNIIYVYYDTVSLGPVEVSTL